MNSTYLNHAFEQHHQKAVMILGRHRANPNNGDGRLGYQELAAYVAEGFTEPVERTDLYLRLLACVRAERLPLPSVVHMRGLMAAIWNSDTVPPEHGQDFEQVCSSISESICYDIGKYATDSMQSIAHTLRVHLEVQMEFQMGGNSDYQKSSSMIQEPHQTDAPNSKPLTKVEGKPTLH